MQDARFIVFEGIDGSGTTTQVQALAARFQAAGIQVIQTREPGGTPIGERLRGLLLDRSNSLADATEMFLYAASRAQHVAEVIRPALARGVTVISDRFVDSSLAYQGCGRGLGVEAVRAVNTMAVRGCSPDLVIYLDVAVAVAQRRRRQRGGAPDRLEAVGTAFEASVAAAYRRLAADRGADAILLDGTRAPEELSQQIWDHVRLRWLAPVRPAVDDGRQRPGCNLCP